MRKTVLLLFALTSVFAKAQEFNSQKGYVAGGYDVVAYFDNEALKGDKAYTARYEGATFRFSSAENLGKFKSDPEKYIPRYGGYCAYAMGKKGEKVSIDPETFEIRDGSLFLFYNSWGNSTLESWLKESPEKLKAQADRNWEKLTRG